ncbi:MAG: hypothetical protein Q9208_002279 [Pyrenodesmia sp. 3 TL-2023]
MHPTLSSTSIPEHQDQHPSPITAYKPPPRTFHRTPSSTSISNSERTVTPILNKRSSYSSLQGTSGSPTPPRPPAIRRVSSQLSLDQLTMPPRSSLPAAPEEPDQPVVTAASVAKEHLTRELDVHHEGSGADNSHNTVVILQDDCYGHRYSRPKTSRANLGTIVERPERIHASILGVATAYVRVGGRHAGSHSAPHPKRKAGSLATMPFRIHKTNRRVALLSQAAASVHGARWMEELRAMCDAAESRLAMNGKELARPQPTAQHNEKASSEKEKLHEGDLYLCSGSLEALEGAIGGVCEAVDAVFRDGGPRRAFVCIRPPGHHCSADMPSGFCWVNNVHIGINYATKTHDLTHAAILDFDLHHGDGSQSIAWAHNARVSSMPKNTPQAKRTAIGYFSLHDINSYPCEGGDDEKVMNASLCLENAHGQTVWNVHLQPWKTDQEFWDLYEHRYTAILAKARSFLRFHTERLTQAPLHPRPKAAIFLSAGFDASEWESPGMQRHQVNVPTDFYARFTRDVVAIADEEGLGVDGRVISVLEGGYSDRALMSGVLSHLSGLTAADSPRSRPSTSNGLGQEMSQRLGKLELSGHARHSSGNLPQYCNEALDPEWWSLPCLEEVERLVNPPTPAGAPKRIRSAAAPTYSSATQSYTAKIVSPPQNRRSLSGTGPSYTSSVTSSPRAPSPPPPPVGWATAAHELSKLLVPSDRQTLSCKPEDLNAEATRVRRDRQSNIGLPIEMPANDGKRMQLRDRRARPTKYVSDEEDEKPMSRANRRKTIADVTTLPREEEDRPPLSAVTDAKKSVKPKARRSSMASSVGSVNGDRSSTSSGAPSALISQPQDTVQVKKSRVPSTYRAEPARQRAPKPKPPMPPVPAFYGAPAKSNEDPNAQLTTSEPLAENGTLKNRDVDQLSSGMKKMSIKLNVPSKDEQKIREAKRGPVAPRGRPKSTATKNTELASTSQKPNKTPKAPAQDPSGASRGKDGKIRIEDLLSPNEPSKKEAGIITDSRGIAHHPDPKSPPVLKQESSHVPTFPDPAPPSFLPPPTSAIPAPAPPLDSSNIAPPSLPQPHQARMPQSFTETAMLPSDLPLPPSSPPAQPSPQSKGPKKPKSTASPTTPKRTRQELPIFSSTSPIRFAKAPTGHQGIDQMLAPETQAQNPGLGESNAADAAHPVESVRAGNGMTERKGEETHDVFDVPDSPPPR